MKAAREDYFEIRVRARSPEELKKRVADNELRGFVVARFFEYEDESSRVISTKYRTPEGTSRRLKVNSVYRNYGAVMRRPNRLAE